MKKLLLASMLLIASGQGYAEDKAEDLLNVGIWEIVELKPEANNPLSKQRMYMAFFPNGVLVEVNSPKSDPSKSTSITSTYKFEGDTLIIHGAQGTESEHQVTQYGERIEISVPFGSMVLKPAP